MVAEVTSERALYPKMLLWVEAWSVKSMASAFQRVTQLSPLRVAMSIKFHFFWLRRGRRIDKVNQLSRHRRA